MCGQDCTNYEHHARHPSSSCHKRLLTTDEINADDQENSGGDDLNGAIDTSSEERSVVLGYADRLKDLWRIVTDANAMLARSGQVIAPWWGLPVCSTKLLPEHENEAGDKAIPVSRQKAFAPSDSLCGI